jgi:hypothetical protein
MTPPHDTPQFTLGQLVEYHDNGRRRYGIYLGESDKPGWHRIAAADADIKTNELKPVPQA